MTEYNGKSTEGRDALGRWGKGNPGRKPGSQNKMREKLKGIVDRNIDNLEQWMDELEPPQKVKVLIDLMPFCVSKLQNIALTDDDGELEADNNNLDTWSSDDLRQLITLYKKYEKN